MDAAAVTTADVQIIIIMAAEMWAVQKIVLQDRPLTALMTDVVPLLSLIVVVHLLNLIVVVPVLKVPWVP